MRKLLTASLIAASALIVPALAACNGEHPHASVSVSAAPSGAPYVQRLTADGYKVQKAGTLASVSPAAARFSKYFEGAALGTSSRDGTAELVLQVKPVATGAVHVVVSLLDKRAKARGITVTQPGNLVIIRGKQPKAVATALAA